MGSVNALAFWPATVVWWCGLVPTTEVSDKIFFFTLYVLLFNNFKDLFYLYLMTQFNNNYKRRKNHLCGREDLIELANLIKYFVRTSSTTTKTKQNNAVGVIT